MKVKYITLFFRLLTAICASVFLCRCNSHQGKQVEMIIPSVKSICVIKVGMSWAECRENLIAANMKQVNVDSSLSQKNQNNTFLLKYPNGEAFRIVTTGEKGKRIVKNIYYQKNDKKMKIEPTSCDSVELRIFSRNKSIKSPDLELSKKLKAKRRQ